MFLSGLKEMVDDPENYFFSLSDIIFTNLPNICTVYLCVYFCNKFANPLRTFQLVASAFLVYIISFANWYITSYHIRPHILANGAAPEAFNFFHFSVAVLWVFIRYSLIGFGYYYATKSVKQEKKLRLMEREKHEAEYAFLRAQINPHFLNNTLNFFYSKSLTLSAELSEGIMILSEIMRYSLEIDKDDKTALLDHELAHIKNVIKINQLRFNNKLQLDFDVKGDTKNVRIIPLVLITMVENILKHGDCTDKLNPVYIILSISELDGLIYFNASNKKKTGPKELSSGIGVVNIRKRLAHHYGRNFELNIKESENDYNIELKLPILVAP